MDWISVILKASLNLPAEQEHENGCCQVERDHVHPDVDAEGFEEREEVGGWRSFLLVEDPHLPKIKIKRGVQLESAVISASLSVVLLTCDL